MKNSGYIPYLEKLQAKLREGHFPATIDMTDTPCLRLGYTTLTRRDQNTVVIRIAGHFFKSCQLKFAERYLHAARAEERRIRRRVAHGMATVKQYEDVIKDSLFFKGADVNYTVLTPEPDGVEYTTLNVTLNFIPDFPVMKVQFNKYNLVPEYGDDVQCVLSSFVKVWFGGQTYTFNSVRAFRGFLNNAQSFDKARSTAKGMYLAEGDQVYFLNTKVPEIGHNLVAMRINTSELRGHNVRRSLVLPNVSEREGVEIHEALFGEDTMEILHAPFTNFLDWD